MEPKVVTVFKMFDKTLVGKLPVDQPEFMALIDRENIISEEVKKRMNSTNRSKDIRADVIVGEIEKSLPDREKIDKLFVVMKEYNHGLEKLAQEIENHLDPFGTPFKCKTMAEYINENQYSFQNLSYKQMRRLLVTYGVLTDEEQSRIDFVQNDEKYQLGLVFNYIVNSLYANRTSRLKGFLELLEEDDDPDLKEVAKRLGGSKRVPSDPTQIKQECSNEETLGDTGSGTESSSKPKKRKTDTKAIPSTITLIPVGDSEKVECNGKFGGSYLWEGHDFTITLPPDCADERVNITLEAYLPSSTQEHGLVSAVFNITTNIKRFKKPITIRFPHWVNVKSGQDNNTLHFLICHNDSCEIKNGYFENEESFGSINLSEFCLICICKDLVTAGFTFIKSYFQSSTPQITPSSPSQNVVTVTTLSNLEEAIITTESTTKASNKKYLDLLVLPEDGNEKWRMYCITLDNPTYLQAVIDYLNENWIDPSIQVKILKRKVVFEKSTDDAVAEVCILNKSADGKIIKLLRDNKILKQKVDSPDLNVSKNVGNNNTLIVNNEECEIYFPMCFLYITRKLSSSSSKLKVDGLCGIGQEPSEFSLAFPTEHGYKFEIYVHIKPQIITQTFDCFAVAQMLKENLVSLSNLSYENMKIALYAKSVITRNEKIKIDKMISSTDQIVEVIEIVRISLINEQTSKYKCFLESMEQSDDELLKETARKYRGSQSVPDLISDS